MGTTFNDLTGRPKGGYSQEELEGVLNTARRVLADCSAFTELELDRLMELEVDETDADRLDAIKKLIAEVRRAMSMVTDIEAKLGISLIGRAGVEIDLEDARAEIIGRIARLTA